MTLHGEHGYSQKTASGHASYYFSYPFLQVNGSLTFAGKVYQVTGKPGTTENGQAVYLITSNVVGTGLA